MSKKSEFSPLLRKVIVSCFFFENESLSTEIVFQKSQVLSRSPFQLLALENILLSSLLKSFFRHLLLVFF